MSQFKKYKSKPIEREAFELTKELSASYHLSHKLLVIDLEVGEEKKHERLEILCTRQPERGDFICKGEGDELYVCPRSVFLERNEVPEDEEEEEDEVAEDETPAS